MHARGRARARRSPAHRAAPGRAARAVHLAAAPAIGIGLDRELGQLVDEKLLELGIACRRAAVEERAGDHRCGADAAVARGWRSDAHEPDGDESAASRARCPRRSSPRARERPAPARARSTSRATAARSVTSTSILPATSSAATRWTWRIASGSAALTCSPVSNAASISACSSRRLAGRAGSTRSCRPLRAPLRRRLLRHRSRARRGRGG